MSVQPPKIDHRTYEDIVRQTETLAQTFTAWRPSADGKPDAGRALTRIFGRMAMLVSDRLNQSLDKNFLKFLDLIGTPIRPPQPSRVPLTFSLATGTTTDTLVPAHTQVAASPAEGEAAEVVFETERDLVVTPAQLQAVFVSEPDEDRYSDRTLQATGAKDGIFPIFEGNRSTEHSLYIACDSVFAITESKTVTLAIQSPEAATLKALPIQWAYWDGTDWQSLEPTSSEVSDRQWQLIFDSFPVPARKTLNGTEAAWFRAQLERSLLPDQPSLPSIERILASAEIKHEGKGSVRPELAFFNTTPIDLSKDFYPFGEQPSFNDTLYLACPDFYWASKDGSSEKPRQVTVTLTLSKGLPVKTDSGAEVLWEAWDGQTWQEAKSNDSGASAANLNQGTSFALTLNAPIASLTLNGVTHYWIRARLVKGNYGTELNGGQPTIFTVLSAAIDLQQATTLKVNSVRGFMPTDRIRIAAGTNGQEEGVVQNIDPQTNQIILNTPLKQQHPQGTSVMLLNSSTGFGPPSVESLSFSYTYNSGEVPLSACFTYNHFTYADRTAAANQGGSPFEPFIAPPVRDAALYLGFDQPFSNRANTLYARVEPPFPRELTDSEPVREPAQVIWEYANSAEWLRLGAIDETYAFTEPGLIRFIGPQDLTRRSEFGQNLYWLRARWHSGEFRVTPRLRRLLTNTTWAIQAIAVEGEILGSSTGNPNQTFRVVQSPVLMGQQLEVREPEVPPLAEQQAIGALEGTDAVQIIRDAAGQPEEVWVRWHEVADFYGSGPRDRHYVLDHLTGEVRFGDDQHGKIPPQGRNNVRMSVYQTGGGRQGDQPANTITQLKTTVPYIDSVTNLEAAGGGADRESFERVKERGPKALRHQGRAVTAQDIEDLAYEASPTIARARAITPHFDPVGLQWLPMYHLRLDGAGNIEVQVTLTDAPEAVLDIAIWGPGQSVPYARTRSPNLRLIYQVTDAQFEGGNAWSVTVTNLSSASPKGRVEIAYPGDPPTNMFEFDLPPNNPEARQQDIRTNPYQDIKDAGRIELILVPNSVDAQPTPSLGLLQRVQTYLETRCAPTVDLWATGPDWVRVTVKAEIVPLSLEVADRAGVLAGSALTGFLHPLTGGPKGQGWPFGRYPQLSDLYALLESLDGIDHVRSLTVESSPRLSDIPRDRRDRFLIYSGNHQITLI